MNKISSYLKVLSSQRSDLFKLMKKEIPSIVRKVLRDYKVTSIEQRSDSLEVSILHKDAPKPNVNSLYRIIVSDRPGKDTPFLDVQNTGISGKGKFLSFGDELTNNISKDIAIFKKEFSVLLDEDEPNLKKRYKEWKKEQDKRL